MEQIATRYNDLDLVPRGYNVNPDWSRNFREDHDKVTRVIDQILDMTVKEHTKYEKTVLMDVYFTKYWGWVNYCLVFKLREDYKNLEVLFGSVLESTDDMLRWFDITKFVYKQVFPLPNSDTSVLTQLKTLGISNVTSSSFTYNTSNNTAILTLIVDVTPKLNNYTRPFTPILSKTTTGIMINFYMQKTPNFVLQDVEVIYPDENVTLIQEDGDYILQEEYITEYSNTTDTYFIEVEQ
jgi:hypothetical protein